MAAVAWPRRVTPPAGDKQAHHVHNGATGVAHAAWCRPRLLVVPHAARVAASNPERSRTCLQVKPPHRHAMSARAEHQPAASAPTNGLAGMPSNNRDVGVIHLWCGGKSQLCWHRPCACTLQLRQHGCEDHRALKLPPHNVHMPYTSIATTAVFTDPPPRRRHLSRRLVGGLNAGMGSSAPSRSPLMPLLMLLSRWAQSTGEGRWNTDTRFRRRCRSAALERFTDSPPCGVRWPLTATHTMWEAEGKFRLVLMPCSTSWPQIRTWE